MQQLQSAVQAYQGRDLDGAEAIFKQILAVNPKEPTALHLLGCIYKDRGQLQQAVELIQASIREDESNPIPFFNLGKILAIAGQHENAVGVFQESLKRNQQIPETWFCFANALREIGKTEEAKRAYRNALQLNPAHAGAAGNLGALLTDDGELDEAEKVLRRALASNPEDINCLVNLGILLKEEGEFEEAIASYRKAIEVKPDFVDAYLNLGGVLKDVGRMDEVRQIVAALRQMKSLEDETLVAIQDKTLVFDWHHRRALSLFCEVELAAAFSGMESSSHFDAVKQVDALCFPASFLGEQIACEEGKLLYEKGYLVDEGLVSADLCAQLISQFNNRNERMSAALIETVLADGVLRSVLERISLHTGFPHLIWNCIYFTKGPDDEAVSDAWHYDNHYNVWTPKLMIYLNSQREEGGATHFVDAALSRQISEKSDYMGLVFQRESYSDRVKGLVEELNIDPVTLDPEHYVFSPERAGSGVWFCPARSLHRGVSPKKGVRQVLSFSLTPLPRDCGWSVDQCVEKSIEILKDKIEKGRQKDDVNPYWTAA
ncbi:tetratricopeptide repeat protein [Prochlorococcus marinus]|uniref:Fe2OG dioxygenase domain-containing protein n=1 Tax=Prochlorococcus marinus (strain MIT 9303) TaxID=59922 RepID=A2CCE2_PROM3|nr:tetratricopeptide repeat protein [Prochlorococcus marinus]ABM79152.1 Hypothetical protein P9303_24191 [Prochlorococcus marinus str. MIT 9303]